MIQLFDNERHLIEWASPTQAHSFPGNRYRFLVINFSVTALDHSISVVIPTHDRPLKTQAAVESVLNQSTPVDEIIVIDDGSTNSNYLSNEPNVRVVHTTQNKGVSAARNLGIRLATSTWIGFLDSDDTWKTTKWQAQLKAIKDKPEYLFCHTNENWIRNGRFVNQMKKHQKHGGWIYDKCLPLCAISPSSAVMHKSLFETVGFFDETLPACEDYDLWLRITALLPVLYIDSPQIEKTGGHADQLSQKHWGMDRFRVQALEKQLNNPSLKKEWRLPTLETLLKKLEILEQGAKKRDSAKAELYKQKRLRWSKSLGPSTVRISI